MNQFYGLETPAANGVGAARDVSSCGRTKTFLITGTLVGTITVEASNDNTSYFPVFSVTQPTKRTIELPARYLRVRVSGFVSGQGSVDLSATDEGIKYANLAVSAGDGVGAATDIGDHGTCKSILVGGTWTGVVLIEISEDNVDFSQLAAFAANDLVVREFVANYIRVRRQGGSTGTPNVDIASANDDNPETNLFGDGSDGDVTLSGDDTLTRDMYYDTLNVAGYHLNTAGYRVFCKTELFIAASGLVHYNGNDAAAEVGGAALATGMVGGSSDGGDGTTTAGDAGGALSQAMGGTAGAGGAGTGGAGGAAGARTALTVAEPQPHAVPICLLPIDPSSGVRYQGGVGGGGGGGDGATNEGGGGGGGGGVVVIAARKINVSVTSAAIAANGGNGADGTATDCGGGGGGSGGAIVLTYRTLDNRGSIAAIGGTAGASGGGSGVAGSAGGNGNVFYNQV